MSLRFPDILLNSLENGHMIVDENFIVTYWNRWLVINTQISYDEIIGKSLEEFYPQLNYTILRRKIKTALQLNTPSFYDPTSSTKFISINRNKVTTSSLSLMQQQVTISPYVKELSQVMISIYDISELHETKLLFQNEIEKVNSLNKVLKDDQEIINKNIMMIKTSTSGTIIEVSALFCEFFEYEEEKIIGKNTSILRKESNAKSIYKELKKTIIDKQSWTGEVEIKTSTGKEKWVEIRISPIYDSNDNLIEFNTIFYDITNEKLLEILSRTDALTKLNNRAYFDEVVHSITLHQRKSETDFVLVITDIDHFKSVNDTYGHLVGDIALVDVANVLKNLLRANDLIARWGGEEFIIMLKNVTINEAQMITEKLRIAVEETRINDQFNLTCSFGISKYIPNESVDATLKRADDALYEAKHNGRNQFILN